MTGPLVLALTLSSCSQVEIRNEKFCGSLGPEGAACFDMLDDATQTMTLQQWAARWDDLSDPVICTSASSFADIKAEIEQLCSYENNCTYQIQQAVDSVAAKFEDIQSKAEEMEKPKR